jgi:general secretion pathway protein G
VRKTVATVKEEKRREKGITLLEIMIVLAIIGLVMGVLVGPKVYRAFQEAKVRTAFLMLKEYESAYTRWVTDSDNECPDKLEDLLKYTNKKDLKDPWGSPFVMKCGDQAPTESHFGVISLGPDKKEGTEDDLHSWDSKPKT